MRNIENAFYNTDFSKYTDLKDRLAKQLFRNNDSADKVVSFRPLTSQEISLVNAAGDILTMGPDNKNS